MTAWRRRGRRALGRLRACEVASIVALLRVWGRPGVRRQRPDTSSFPSCGVLLSRRTALNYFVHYSEVLLPSTRDNFRIPIDRCIWIKVPWKHNAYSAQDDCVNNGFRAMIEDQKSNSSTSTRAGSSSRRSLVLALVILAQFMVVIDFTIVQVALPSIGREVGVSINGLQWIVTAYSLTWAGFLMLSGRMGDIYGHKRLFIIGVLLFSLASLTGGLAPSEIVLIVARGTSGTGGTAMAAATGLSILVGAFPEGKERNRVLGVIAQASGSGFAAGMILGGVITTTFGWRWVFDINVPIGLVVSLLSIR